MEIDNIKDINQLYLFADGKEIFRQEIENLSFPIQFSFQVWIRGRYTICLGAVNKNEKTEPISKPEEANTYEHMVCHVTFSKGNKQEGKGKED